MIIQKTDFMPSHFFIWNRTSFTSDHKAIQVQYRLNSMIESNVSYQYYTHK